MKAILLTAIAVCLCFAGCATVPTQTPAQIAAILCPQIQSELTTLQLSGVFTGGAQTTLTDKVQPDVDKVCAAGVSVTVLSLTNLSTATFPAVIAIINGSSLTQQNKTIAVLAVGAFQSFINTRVSLAMPTAAPVLSASGVIVA